MTVVAFIAALCCVLIAPAVAASRAGWRHGPVDLPVPLAYAFGGLGVASVSIWVAGWAWEINTWTVFGAPLGVSARSGRREGRPLPSAHTTVRTVPYTAVQVRRCRSRS